MAAGVPRKIDHLGRIVVPVEFRRALGIREGDELDVALDGDRVVLARRAPACVFCGGDDDLGEHRSRWVCAGCRRSLAATS